VRGLDLNNLPGWDIGSVGYHGDDGRVWNSNTGIWGSVFRDGFGTGDTVGCGITLDRQRIFLTKNGTIIGELNHSRSGVCRVLMWLCRLASILLSIQVLRLFSECIPNGWNERERRPNHREFWNTPFRFRLSFVIRDLEPQRV